MMQTHRRRVASIVVPALLGVASVLEATPVSSHVRFRVLTGVIAYTDPRQGFAIIGDSVQNTFLVRSGQQLPDGSWIREIHPKDVLLEHEGGLETLGMHERAESPGAEYAEMSPQPIPQPVRWEEEARRRTGAGEMRPNPLRSADAEPDPLGPGETRRNELPANGVRLNDMSLSGTPPSDAMPRQAQPRAPLPDAQDPADEFAGDARRQRADRRGNDR